ncbi:hypothetical protein [Mucilaginibacter sp.]|uniref:hypothetical protein n=1 Tax=Mucilaginibacter sp. TaxID=1882438 RepID=UPI0035BBB078
MKNVFKLLMIAALFAVASCNSNSPNNSDSTKAAADSNKKELAAKDSTQFKADYEFAVTAANGSISK